MEITEKQIKKMLQADYIDSLAQFAGLVLEISNSTEETDLEDIINDIDKIAWDIAWSLGPEKQDQWLQIYTALLCGC